MALRKALAYSKKHARPYTRKSKNKSKSYIKVVPHNKIVKYNMGNVKLFNEGKLKYKIILTSLENIQIRDNALESARLIVNKNLEKRMPGRFYFMVNVYPHHILRNNKTAAGAGADRLSSGMKHSFGIVEGRAAMVNAGKDILTVYCETESDSRTVREIMGMVKAKIPCQSKISLMMK